MVLKSHNKKETMPSTIRSIPNKTITAATQDEQILVIKRTTIFGEKKAWHGINRENISDCLTKITKYKEFHSRSIMEQDNTYKQIIPYLVFTHQGQYFLMQREKNISEKRLQNKFSLGIGGHIRKEDMVNNSIFDWATREFHEEISYDGSVAVETIGILNDDSNEVGKVHLGIVLLLCGNTNTIAVRSELKSGTLVSLEECARKYNQLESWSQIVYNFLRG